MNKIFEKLANFTHLQSYPLLSRKDKQTNPCDKAILVHIHYDSDSKLDVKIPAENQKHLTCQWLVDEVAREINKAEKKRNLKEEAKSIVILKTKNNEYAVDYLFNDPNQSLEFLKSGTILKPYYGSNERSLDEFGNKVELSDFEIETKLGYGAFSNVYLVRKKSTGRLYALKQVRKENLSRRRRKMLESERNSLIQMNSPFIVPIHWIFQTANYCYFVLDFVPCGDLHRVLKHRKRLSESETKFFIAEAILGLNTIHENNFLYRDLKPENLLLNLDGHIQLTDFGLVKKVGSIHDPNYSRCGTFEIMAPEIVREQSHNCLADYYNIGTLAFELVTGRIPYLNPENRSFDDKHILESLNISSGLQDFISRLLDPNPETRLGAKKGLNEICDHPWLRNLDMKDVSKKHLTPPIKIDPYSLKFKIKGIDFDIDTGEDHSDHCAMFKIQKNLESDRNLFNFSFYGFADESLDRVVLSKSPCSFNKLPTMNNIATAYSPYADSIIQGASMTRGISRFNTATDISNETLCVKKISCNDTHEISDESESPASKLKKYVPKELGTNKLENKLSKLTPFFNSPLL